MNTKLLGLVGGIIFIGNTFGTQYLQSTANRLKGIAQGTVATVTSYVTQKVTTGVENLIKRKMQNALQAIFAQDPITKDTLSFFKDALIYDQNEGTTFFIDLLRSTPTVFNEEELERFFSNRLVKEEAINESKNPDRYKLLVYKGLQNYLQYKIQKIFDDNLDQETQTFDGTKAAQALETLYSSLQDSLIVTSRLTMCQLIVNTFQEMIPTPAENETEQRFSSFVASFVAQATTDATALRGSVLQLQEWFRANIMAINATTVPSKEIVNDLFQKLLSPDNDAVLKTLYSKITNPYIKALINLTSLVRNGMKLGYNTKAQVTFINEFQLKDVQRDLTLLFRNYPDLYLKIVEGTIAATTANISNASTAAQLERYTQSMAVFKRAVLLSMDISVKKSGNFLRRVRDYFSVAYWDMKAQSSDKKNNTLKCLLMIHMIQDEKYTLSPRALCRNIGLVFKFWQPNDKTDFSLTSIDSIFQALVKIPGVTRQMIYDEIITRIPQNVRITPEGHQPSLDTLDAIIEKSLAKVEQSTPQDLSTYVTLSDTDQGTHSAITQFFNNPDSARKPVTQSPARLEISTDMPVTHSQPTERSTHLTQQEQELRRQQEERQERSSDHNSDNSDHFEDALETPPVEE